MRFDPLLRKFVTSVSTQFSHLVETWYDMTSSRLGRSWSYLNISIFKFNHFGMRFVICERKGKIKWFTLNIPDLININANKINYNWEVLQIHLKEANKMSSSIAKSSPVWWKLSRYYFVIYFCYAFLTLDVCRIVNF